MGERQAKINELTLSHQTITRCLCGREVTLVCFVLFSEYDLFGIDLECYTPSKLDFYVMCEIMRYFALSIAIQCSSKCAH